MNEYCSLAFVRYLTNPTVQAAIAVRLWYDFEFQK